MDWNTIPIEIIERILVFTGSPRTVLNASSTSKNWRAIGEDQLLWRELFYVMTAIKYGGKFDNEVDWKKKVKDTSLIRTNIKQGRCVVKTLSTTEITHKTTLQPDNSAVHKDFHLVNWQTIEHRSAIGNVKRLKSHFIDMVREECIEIDDKEITFIGKYIAKSDSSNSYRGMSYNVVQVHVLDEEKAREGQVFDPSKAIKLPIPENIDNRPIINYCDHSKYIGFYDCPYGGPCTAYIIDGTTGTLACRENIPAKDASSCYLGLYDNYFAITPKQPTNVREHSVILIDVESPMNKITKKFKERYEMCLMREHEIVFRCAKNFIIWNYKSNTEKEYPVGQVELLPVKMIYNDMWIAIESYNMGLLLSFYDMNDGAKVGSVSFKNNNTTPVGNGLLQLSDGRLAVCLTSGCHVISFMNSEVTRMIKVLLMDVKGNVKEHEIMACQLVDFFIKSAKSYLPDINSRVVLYQPHSENARYVMLFSFNIDRAHNATATALLKDAVTPTQVNTPYEGWVCGKTPHTGWRCGNKAVDPKSLLVATQVYGPVVIVKERKIDGRWQLA